MSVLSYKPVFGLTWSERPLWSPHLNVRQLIFGRTGVGRSTPQHKTAIIDAYSWSSYLADQVLADLPHPHPTANDNNRFLLLEVIFGRPSVGTSTPPPHQMVIIESYSECPYWQTQVLADLPPYQMVILDAYSESSYLPDQVFCRQDVLCERPFTHKGNFLILAHWQNTKEPMQSWIVCHHCHHCLWPVSLHTYYLSSWNKVNTYIKYQDLKSHVEMISYGTRQPGHHTD